MVLSLKREDTQILICELKSDLKYDNHYKI